MSKTNNVSSQMQDLQSKYSNPTSSNNSKNANLMVQMNLYDNEKINNNILELEEIHDSQVNRLNSLKEEDPQKCFENCNKFLEENNDIIEKQMNKIIDLEKNIKNVVEECDYLEFQEEKLNAMLKEQKYVDLANKIKKMRSSIDNLNFYLVKKNISNFKN